MKYLLILAAVLGIVAVGSANSFAATDIYMQYGTILGESQATDHPQWINLDSMSFSLTNPISIGSATTGAGAGKPQFSAITITKTMDSSSPQLFQELLTSSPTVTDAKIDLVRPGATGQPVTYVEYELTNPHITGYSVSTGTDIPMETLTIQFEKLSFKFTPQNPDGTLGTPITTTWDLATNTS